MSAMIKFDVECSITRIDLSKRNTRAHSSRELPEAQLVYLILLADGPWRRTAAFVTNVVS